MIPPHYDTLGLHPSATAAEVTRRYRQLSLQFHPDRASYRDNSLDTEAHVREQFQRVAEAYAVLSDPLKRAAYDTSYSVNFFGRAGAVQAAIAAHNRRTSLSSLSLSSSNGTARAGKTAEEMGGKRTRSHDKFKLGQGSSRHSNPCCESDSIGGCGLVREGRARPESVSEKGQVHSSDADDDEDEEYDCREASRTDDVPSTVSTRENNTEDHVGASGKAVAAQAAVNQMLRRMFALRPRMLFHHCSRPYDNEGGGGWEGAECTNTPSSSDGLSPSSRDRVWQSAGVMQQWREVTLTRDSTARLWGLVFDGNVLVRCDGHAGVPFPAVVTQLNGCNVGRQDDVAALIGSPLPTHGADANRTSHAYDAHGCLTGTSTAGTNDAHAHPEGRVGGQAAAVDATAPLQLRLMLTYAVTPYDVVVAYKEVAPVRDESLTAGQTSGSGSAMLIHHSAEQEPPHHRHGTDGTGTIHVAHTTPRAAAPSRNKDAMGVVDTNAEKPQSMRTGDSDVLNLLLPRGQVAAELTALLPGVCVTTLDGVRVSCADELRSVLYARIAQAHKQEASETHTGIDGTSHDRDYTHSSAGFRHGRYDSSEDVVPVHVSRGMLLLAAECVTLAGVPEAVPSSDTDTQAGALLHVYDAYA